MKGSELDALKGLEELADSQFRDFLRRNRHTPLEASLVAESVPAQEIDYRHNSIEFRGGNDIYSYSVGILCRDEDSRVIFGEPADVRREAFNALYYANTEGAEYTFRHDESFLLWEVFTQAGLLLPVSNQDPRFKDVVAAEVHTPRMVGEALLKIKPDGSYC